MPVLPVIFVCGPTASGKTALAVALAGALGGEVISADSMQVYKGMDIATAKPTADEMGAIPHHLLGAVDIGTPMNAALWAKMAQGAMEAIQSRGKRVIVCGGTGLYMDALLFGLDAPAGGDAALRAELLGLAQKQGAYALHARLAAVDPAAAATIHPNNQKRVIRALEVAMAGKPAVATPPRAPRFTHTRLILTAPRDVLYARINARAEDMLARGLLGEARELRGLLEASPTAAWAIGYKELYAHIDGEATLAEAADGLKRATRRYAKRQITWLKRYKCAHELDITQYRATADLCRAALDIIEGDEHESPDDN